MQKLKLLAGGLLTALFLIPALGSAQTISIVSGNGQLVCPDCAGAGQRYTPLVVQVNTAAGAPSVNTSVTWTVTQQGSATITATSVTNSSGQATYTFSPLAFFFGSDFLSATIVASISNASVTFTETTAIPSGTGQAATTISLQPSGAAPPLTGAAGTTATTSISVIVTGLFAALPGVSVSLTSGTAGHPTVSCQTQTGQAPGTVVTNSLGIAVCTPVFGGTLGSGSYTIVVGGTITFSASPLTVTPGTPAVMKIISGNNQSVNAGSEATSALVAQITDLGGNASNGAKVTWTVTGGTATLANALTTSLPNGQVSAYVFPTAGPVSVTVALASNASVKAVFTMNVNTVVTVLQAITATTQSTKVNTAFPDALVVQANDNTTPVSGVTVGFVVTSGPVTLSATSAVTNAQGQAQVTATAGATAGPAVVTASITSSGKTYTQAFNLTVLPNGATIMSVVNSAGFQNQFVSPCSLATIYGTGLATGIQGVASAFLEPQNQVAGVTVAFNGELAPILDVANVNGQESVSVQIPCDVQAGTPAVQVPMVVTVDGTPSPAFTVNVSTYSPGIFQFVDPTDNVTRAVLVRPDGSYVSAENPARRGETIRMFVTGLGQTSPALNTNELDPTTPGPNNTLIPEFPAVNASMVVGINNAGVSVLSATYAYGMVGVYEVDFQVPADTATGNNAPFAIAITVGNTLLFGNPSIIPIL